MSLEPTAVAMEAVVAERDEEQEEVDSGAREGPMLEAADQASGPVLAEVEEHFEPQHFSPELELSSNVPADPPPDEAGATEVDDAAPTCGPPFQTPALAHVTGAGAGEAASASSSDSQFSVGQSVRGGGAHGHGQAGGRSSASRKKSAAKRPGIR